jgi:predicted nucleic acid-binding protein
MAVTGSSATRSTNVRFVDTNVLLYAISTSPADQGKPKQANMIVDAGNVALSVQVLQEFYVQATRPSRADAIGHDQAVGLIETWMRFPVQEITRDVMRAALATKVRFGISYWDAAIIEAARSLGCDTVLSEDLSTETDYDGMRVENPFK